MISALFDRDPDPPERRYVPHVIHLRYEDGAGVAHDIEADVLEDGELDRVRVVTERHGEGPLRHWHESAPAEDVLSPEDYLLAMGLLDDLAGHDETEEDCGG